MTSPITSPCSIASKSRLYFSSLACRASFAPELPTASTDSTSRDLSSTLPLSILGGTPLHFAVQTAACCSTGRRSHHLVARTACLIIRPFQQSQRQDFEVKFRLNSLTFTVDFRPVSELISPTLWQPTHAPAALSVPWSLFAVSRFQLPGTRRPLKAAMRAQPRSSCRSPAFFP